MLRLIIVDDEALSRQRLRYLLSGLTDVVLVGEASSVADAILLIERERPDGMLLDIEMGDGTGFDVLRRLDDPPAVVFVTAYSHHAVDAFGVQAIDYLMKPVRPIRLEEALRRLQTALSRSQPRNPEPAAPDLFYARMPGRLMTVPHDEIVFLKAERDYTRIIIDGRPPLLVRQPFGRCIDEMSGENFLRLGRSLVVNSDRIDEVIRKSRDRTEIRLVGWNKGLIIGRAASDDLRRQLSAFPSFGGKLHLKMK